MNTQLKHRIIGASVLVAIAAIVLPDILDGQKTERQQDFAAIPLRPNVDTPEFDESYSIEPLEEPNQLNVAAGEVDLEKSAAGTSAQASEGAEERDIVENIQDQKLPQFDDNAWVLQLGVFRNATNVNVLVQKLRNAGFPAFTKPKKPVQGKPTWVYVGPDIKKQKLRAIQPDVKRITGLKGRLFPYNPQSQ